MTVLDWAIVAFTLALALWGYRQGLIVGALTLGRLRVGAFLGVAARPARPLAGPDSPYAPLCGAIGALLVGALAAVVLEGMALALRRRLIRRPMLHRADGAGGAALIGAVALGLAWIFGAVALHAPGTTQLRADVQNSVILSELDQVLPPSGGVLNVLDRVDPAPSITGPATPTRVAQLEDRRGPRRRSAGGSVVRVLSTACGLGIEGSGWAVRPDLIVTNAHVVAGPTDTTVTTQSGVELDATAVYYQPQNDLALLRVESQLPTLPIAYGTEGEDGGGARLSRERSLHGDPGAGRRDPRHAQRGLLRARADRADDHLARRRRAQRQLGRAAARPRRARWSGSSSRRPPSGPTGGFAVPAEEVEEAIHHVSAGAVVTGACTR